MYDWKITLKKALKHAVYIFIAGLAAKYGNSNWFLAAHPLFAAIENYLKHRKDE